jgi:hypothetical protein
VLLLSTAIARCCSAVEYLSNECLSSFGLKIILHLLPSFLVGILSTHCLQVAMTIRNRKNEINAPTESSIDQESKDELELGPHHKKVTDLT